MRFRELIKRKQIMKKIEIRAGVKASDTSLHFFLNDSCNEDLHDAPVFNRIMASIGAVGYVNKSEVCVNIRKEKRGNEYFIIIEYDDDLEI